MEGWDLGIFCCVAVVAIVIEFIFFYIVYISFYNGHLSFLQNQQIIFESELLIKKLKHYTRTFLL